MRRRYFGSSDCIDIGMDFVDHRFRPYAECIQHWGNINVDFTKRVQSIAARVDDLIIRPGGVLRRREWGLYEVGILGPDGMLVRIGWPSRLMQDKV